MGALMRLGQVAQRLGHRVDVLFRADMYKMPQYNTLLIRTRTDPLNSSYVASRLAQHRGLRVIDDPDSIIICCDKVNMYRYLMRRHVPLPEAVFLGEADLSPQIGAQPSRSTTTRRLPKGRRINGHRVSMSDRFVTWLANGVNDGRAKHDTHRISERSRRPCLLGEGGLLRGPL